MDANGEYAVVHVEPSKKRLFKRDLNYHLLTDDLNSWITGNYRISSNVNPVFVSLDNSGVMKNVQQSDNYPMSSKALDTSESNVLQSYLNPTYDSFWSLLQSPFKTLSQLTNWNSGQATGGWSFIPLLSSSNYQNSISSSSLNALPSNNLQNSLRPISSSISTNSFQNTFPIKSISGMNSHPMTNSYASPILEEYKSAESTNAVHHSSGAAQEQSPVYLSAFVPNFRLDIYHNLDEIYDYLERLASMHKHIRIYAIGFSHEKRPIKAVEIHQDIANLDRKMVYLDGLIHAREHITSAALLNIIEQILIRKIRCNFLIVPVINVSHLI